MAGDFTQLKDDAERLGGPWADALMALLSNTVDGIEMPEPAGVDVASSLVMRQRVLRAVLRGDREALDVEIGRTQGTGAVNAIAARWRAVIDARPLPPMDQDLLKEAAAVDPSLAVEALSLEALHMLNEGDTEQALRMARRASRMAASESLLQGEYLANLVLARTRRHSGMGHFAVRVLRALDAVVPPVWKPWVSLESELAGASALGKEHRTLLTQAHEEIETLRSLTSFDATPTASASDWIEGHDDRVPFGLRAPSDDPLCVAAVVATPAGLGAFSSLESPPTA